MVPSDPDWFTTRTGEVRAELVRVDSKASTLMAVAGAALTVGLAALARVDLPAVALAAGVLTVALIGVAVALLAFAVRPCLGSDHGLVHYATAMPGELLVEASVPAAGSAAEQARHLVFLSRAAVRKYRRVRLAVDLLLAGLVGTGVTAVVAVVA